MRHQLVHEHEAALGGVRAQRAELINQARHRTRGSIEVSDLDVTSAETLGGIEEQLAPRIRGDPARIGRVDEPIDQELDLHVLHAVVFENAPHFRQAVTSEHALQVRMPQAYTLEAGARRCLDPLAELESAVLEVRVRKGSASQGPVGSNELDAGA